jgi:hypothetical protein
VLLTFYFFFVDILSGFIDTKKHGECPGGVVSSPPQGCQIFLGRYNIHTEIGNNIINGCKIEQMNIKYTKWPVNRQNKHKIYQMAGK